MGLGLIDQAVLADIANAIREQNGTDATYRPADMAAAVLALDGTKPDAGTTATFPSKVGVVSDGVFSAVADAIRKQNGSITKYRPAEMGDAIRALTWAWDSSPARFCSTTGRWSSTTWTGGR